MNYIPGMAQILLSVDLKRYDRGFLVYGARVGGGYSLSSIGFFVAGRTGIGMRLPNKVVSAWELSAEAGALVPLASYYVGGLLGAEFFQRLIVEFSAGVGLVFGTTQPYAGAMVGFRIL
jgi:hypothetical protein